MLWILAALCRSLVADCVPANGLVAWWPADANGNDIVSTNNGILKGGANASAPGIVGSAYSFDGTNGYVEIPDSSVLRQTNFTIEAWARFDSLDSPASGNSPAGQQYLVFREGVHLEYFAGFAFTKVRVPKGDVFAFEVDSSDGQAVRLLSQTLVVTGAWYHVAGVRGTNYLQLYVNGQLESQAHVNFPQSYGDYPLYLGTTAQPSWDHKFSGMLDEVALYDRALTSNQIAALYASPAGGKCKPLILSQPESQTLSAGANASFAITAWFRARWITNGRSTALILPMGLGSAVRPARTWWLIMSCGALVTRLFTRLW